jgi:Copper binding periplasmic protein CusF
MRSMARLLSVTGVLLLLAPALHAEGPALTLGGEGRVVAVDRVRGWITIEHGPIEDLFVAGQTEFPVQADDLLGRVRVDDRIAFTLGAPREGHGELSISDLRVLGRGPRDSLWTGLSLQGVELAVLGSLLAAVIVLLGLQTRRLRQLVHGNQTTIAGLREQIRLQREMNAGVEEAALALLPALRSHQSQLRQLGQQIRSDRPTPGADPRPAPETTRPVVVVRAGEAETFRILDERLGRPGLARVTWDRRRQERRSAARPTEPDRRRRERRAPMPVTWQGLGYLLVQPKVRRLNVVA